MEARLPRRVVTVPVHLGQTPLEQVRNQVAEALRRRRTTVVVDVVDFGYFDEDLLAELMALVASDSRITLRGLTDYATILLHPEPAPVDVRTAAERVVVHLESVTVITGSWRRQPLDAATWDEALSVADSAGRGTVTLDLRDVWALSAHQLLSLAELSADLARELRMLIIVNVHPAVDDQLRTAGLHGDLLIGAAESE